MPDFAAVLLDLDGLLIDTESIARSAGHEALIALGHEVDPEVLVRLVGLDRLSGTALLAKIIGPRLDLEALDTEWSRRVQARYHRDGIACKPGVEALFEALDRMAMPRAVVTSSSRDGARRKLGIAGLASRITVLVGVDDVQQAKPHPEPYLRGAELLGVDPARCIAFEDSDTGARAARAAGCFTVQIPDLVGDSIHAHIVAETIVEGALRAGLLVANQ